MNEYDDILNLPHHVSASRPQMNMRSRAAQFSPFAALTGYEDLLEQSESDTSGLEFRNERNIVRSLRQIIKDEPEHPAVCLRRFNGKAYEEVNGVIRSLDEEDDVLTLTSGEKIPLGSILRIIR